MSVSHQHLSTCTELAPQTGRAFVLRQDQYLKVIDVRGEQVADLFCFDFENRRDALSSGRSIDYAETTTFTRGHRLYAHSGQVMLQIVEDTCGRHDFLVTPCSAQMFRMISGRDDYHPSCQENLERSLAEFDIQPHQITTTFNIFMNVPIAADGRIRVEKPLSRAGDSIIFRAERDLIVGLTACSDEGTNAGSCKPIAFEILEASFFAPDTLRDL